MRVEKILNKTNDNKTQKFFLPQNAIIFCNNAFCHFFAFLFFFVCYNGDFLRYF